LHLYVVQPCRALRPMKLVEREQPSMGQDENSAPAVFEAAEQHRCTHQDEPDIASRGDQLRIRPGGGHLAQFVEEIFGIVEMLDDVERQDEIELLTAEIGQTAVQIGPNEPV